MGSDSSFRKCDESEALPSLLPQVLHLARRRRSGDTFIYQGMGGRSPLDVTCKINRDREIHVDFTEYALHSCGEFCELKPTVKRDFR